MTKTSTLDVAPAPWLELANLILFSDKHRDQLSSFFFCDQLGMVFESGSLQADNHKFVLKRTNTWIICTNHTNFFESLPRRGNYRRASPRMLQLNLASLSGLLIPHFKAGDFKDCCS